MKNLNFLFWAYTLIWIVLVVYLVSLSVRLRAISSQLQRLRSRLAPEEKTGR